MRIANRRRPHAKGVVIGVLSVGAMLGGAPPVSAALPDGRGYELVSPPQKNGGDVLIETARTRAAVDGDAVVFSSLTGFGDVRGSSAATEYMSLRRGRAGTPGWETHAITPRQPAMTFVGSLEQFDPLFVGEFSDDLRRAVYRSWLPVSGAGTTPNVAEVPNLYVGDALNEPGQGVFGLITDSVEPLVYNRDAPWLAGTSKDLEHVFFESRQRLTTDAFTGVGNLYEWVDGRVRLAGVLPDGTVPPGGSRAGLGAATAKYTDRTVSEDGQRVFFQDNDLNNVYVRQGGRRTIQLNASEKTDPEAPQPATFWSASANGERVFFTTSEGLVDGDDAGANDVYMYDFSAPVGTRLTRVSNDEEFGDGEGATDNVIDASADGRVVYFVHTNQLVAGEDTPVNRGLFMWRDGAVKYIGRFTDPLDPALNGPDHLWIFTDNQTPSRVSPDGAYLVFTAHNTDGFVGRSGFAGYDHGTCTLEVSTGAPCREVYVYSADTGRLACASCNVLTGVGASDALLAFRQAQGGASTTTHRSRALSSDGQWVFFSTREALVPEDVNGRWDAYQYSVREGQAELISTGRSTNDSFFVEASPDGRDVFFVTAERLVGWDRDQNNDLYDARIGGGVPDPVSPAPACSGDTCKGPQAAPPVTAGVGSAIAVGPGDADEPLRGRQARARKRCRSGKVRRLVRGKRRCVQRTGKRGKPTRRKVR